MRCDPRSLLTVGLSLWLASAARPTNFASITSDLVGRSAPADCPQEEPLLQALLGLGLKEDRLWDLHYVHGVTWSGCDVLKIDLRNYTELRGSLSKGFLELPKLEFLNLKGTKVSGDLAVLANCKALIGLDLSETKIMGDLNALENGVDLEYLRLSQTEVTGDLEVLKHATKLRHIYLSDTKVKGNIESFQELPWLRSLHLENTSVSGDMSSLRELKGLDDVDISGTKISGTRCQREEELLQQALLGLGFMDEELRDLRDVDGVSWSGCDISWLDLGGKELQGSLSPAFLNFPELQYLNLSGTEVSGDLAVLAKCSQLAELDLSKTKVAGDVKALQNAPYLQKLRLVDTEISGDMASLRDAKWLTDVNITGTRITGTRCSRDEDDVRQLFHDLGLNDEKLSDLHDVEGVEWHDCDVFWIDLGGKELQGSLSPAFLNFPKLQYLNLSGTEVSGDLAMLAKCSQLAELDLSKTKVAGDVKALQNASNLKKLNLSETKIFGEMASLRPLKGLRNLDTSGTQIRGTRCSHNEGRVRQLLQDLGLKDVELTDVRKLAGVRWKDCMVVSINFFGRQDLQGFLSPVLCELPVLQKLNLAATQISGDLETLSGCKSLEHLSQLHLWHTKVTGTLEALRKVTWLKRLLLHNTQVTGELKALENLKRLFFVDLSETQVAGDLRALRAASWLNTLLLSQTQVTGDLNALFRSARNLATLDLSHTKVTGRMGTLGPKLRHLDISGISITGDITDLRSDSLVTLKAAGCGLKGALMQGHSGQTQFPELVTLDLASNKIAHVEEIPFKCRNLILADNPEVGFAPGILSEAVQDKVFVNLRNVNVTNRTEASDLLDRGIAQQSGGRTGHPDQGFACYEVVAASLEVSPEKFAPERLCTCMPGWTGTGATCTKCPRNTFKENFSDTSDACSPCPNGSTAEEGSATHSSCICRPGKLYQKGGSWACGCPEYEALDEDVCVKCDERNLNCSAKGSDVLRAHPKAGFYRLGNETKAVQCLEPKERCSPELPDLDSDEYTWAMCHSNYTGTMCMDCAETFYASGERCEKCVDAEIPHAVLLVLVVALAVAGGLAALLVWHRLGSNAHETASRRSTLLQQLKAQAPLLLQMCQLWAVLATIATQTPTDRPEGGEDKSKLKFWEVPYIEVLQLSVANVKGAMNLQCRADGQTVRFVLALAAPVFPLLALLCCFLVELMKPGLGITAALQALTLFYVGGASSTSTLLRCQRKDGGGEALPEAFAFRSSMPYFLCDDESPLKHRVDIVGYTTAVFYILLIPSCLLYLYWRQRRVLRGSGTTMWAPAPGNDGLDVRVFSLEPRTSTQKPLDEHTQRLIAAAAACIAVLYRGRVQVRIVDQAAMVRPVEAAPGSMGEGDLLDMFEAEDASAEALKCRAISKMLTERAILKDALPHERVLSGAKNLLLKYALGRTIWMEIVQKLVAVALVGIVSKIEGAMMPVAVTLVMAVTSAMVQPYVQPQVNTLHCSSFVCLAVSAVGFELAIPWLGRIALAAPFVLSALQALRPDSAEALAIRLWEDLERQIDALKSQEVVEVAVETHRFL